MKRIQAGMISLLALPLLIVGCGNDTSVSVQPTTAEVDAAKQRRVDAIDKMSNLDDATKARMKAQITGASAQSGSSPARH